MLSVLLLTLCACLSNARSQMHMELLLDQSPSRAGTMTPGSGVHRFEANSEISLTAVPEEGYRFAYWLGDVIDPHSNTTQVHLDNSKIVIAVYDPIEGEPSYDEEVTLHGGGGGASQLLPTATQFFRSSFSAPGGTRAREAPHIQVVPVSPVPEPASLLLLGIGAMTLARRRGGQANRK